MANKQHKDQPRWFKMQASIMVSWPANTRCSRRNRAEIMAELARRIEEGLPVLDPLISMDRSCNEVESTLHLGGITNPQGGVSGYDPHRRGSKQEKAL